MEQVTNKLGTTLLDFIRMTDEKTIDPKLHSPLVASLMIVEHNGMVLLVFERQRWGFPSGSIEPGESPRACAIREMMEETGQSVTDLDFLGVIKYRWRDGKTFFGAMYFCSLLAISPFQPNDEIEKTLLWDFHSDIGYVEEMSRYLAEVIIKP